jgi:restriction system protein
MPKYQNWTRGRRQRRSGNKDAVPLVFLLPLLAVVLAGRLSDYFRGHHGEELAFASFILLVMVAVSYFWIRKRWRKHQALRAVDLAQVDSMEGTKFEEYMEQVFRAQGYRVKRTGRAGDQGCDLLLTKGDEKIACQLKCYSRPVSNHAVQQAVASTRRYGADRAMVVTNANYTKSARELAGDWACELIAREELGKMIVAFRAAGNHTHTVVWPARIFRRLRGL